MRICSIASGSSGNCIYVGSDTTHLLIDSGISAKRTTEGLKQLGLTLADIDAVILSHEHSDHVCGLGVLSRKQHLAVYASKGTLEATQNDRTLGRLECDFVPVKKDEKFTIKDLTINPFAISHDAAEPFAYRIQCGRKKVAVCTDLGEYTPYTTECLRGMDALLLEANHDIRMLQVGPYPYYLKQRILGARGHLSNESSGKLLGSILHDKLQMVFLGHLSKENNMPELAYETVRVELQMGDYGYQAKDFDIRVAERSKPSDIIAVS